MRWCVLMAMGVAGLVGSAAAGQPTVRVEVAATEPGMEATLGRDQTFWVRIRYESDESVTLWARPYFHGKEAPAASNPSRQYVGSGYALGWFSFREPAEVDELRISAGGGRPYREWNLASYPVKLRWTGAPAASRATPAWVTELRAADDSANRAAMDSMMNEPVTASDVTLMRGFMLVVLGGMVAGLIAPIVAYRRWKGGWRIAAGVPLAGMCFVIVRIIVGTAIDPTSHNLWPFEIGMVAFLALAFIAVVAIARRVTGAHRG
jgi:hypothetical protein